MRLAVLDVEDADDYLSLRPLPPTADGPPYAGSPSHLSPCDAGPGRSEDSDFAAGFAHLRELELRATSPDFFAELLRALTDGQLAFGRALQGAAGRSEFGAGCDTGAACSGGTPSSGSSSLQAVRLDVGYDPALLELRQLLAALLAPPSVEQG